jgi:hypothetical protein
VKCNVLSTSATEIKCRIDPTISLENGYTAKLLVFLKTSEEANCTAANCDITFTNNVPMINAFNKQFNENTLVWEITATGTGFPGTKDTTELYIGGIKQTTSAQTSSSLTVQITNITDYKYSNAQLFFDIGVPFGNDKVIV